MCLRPLSKAESNARNTEAKQLREAIENGTAEQKEAALTGIVAFIEACGSASEPFTVPITPFILKALADKVRILLYSLEQAGETQAA